VNHVASCGGSPTTVRRIADHRVAGGMTYRHPCRQQRDSIPQKLVGFSMEEDTASDQLLRNSDADAALHILHQKIITTDSFGFDEHG